MELRALERKIHEMILNYRSIENMIINPHFSSLWKRSEDDEKEKVVAMVLDGDKENMAKWIRNHPDKELGEKNTLQLKKIARETGVKNYSRMDKACLIRSIQEASQRERVPNEDPQEMLVMVNDLIKEMKTLLIEANIKKEYFKIPDRVLDLEPHMIREAYAWILRAYEDQYRQAYDIKKLLPQGTWDRYKSWAMFGEHREVELLDKELKNLRRVFVSAKRPQLFKRTIIERMLEKIDAGKKEENKEGT